MWKMNSKLGSKRLWNIMANSAKNSIEAGGWFSSYTHLPFSSEEMNEYVADMKKNICEWIDENSKILEIGCSSGLTMLALCKNVYKYVGIDISRSELDWCRRELSRRQLCNVELLEMPANTIDQLDKGFHGIILNSVVHCFNNIDYLEDVIIKSSLLIESTGFIYIGDVMNLDTKDAFVNSLIEFKKRHPNMKTKTSLENELMISPNYFLGLVEKYSFIKDVEIYIKTGAIENELKKYRYNVMLRIDNANMGE